MQERGNTTVATATYGVAGEMTGLSYFGYSETRTYNALLQMTRQTVSGDDGYGVPVHGGGEQRTDHVERG